MKKYIYTLLITLFISSFSTAQKEENGFTWGARLGLNYSSLYGDDSKGYDVKTGASAALFTRIPMSGLFYFQPELNYTSKGVTDEVVINEIDVEFILAFTYLEVPLLFKYNFGSETEDLFKPELFIGPFGALKVNSEITVEEDVTANSITINDVKGFDYGIVFGAGTGIKIDNVDLLFELRYTLSFSSYDNSPHNLDVKHRVFTLSTGFYLN